MLFAYLDLVVNAIEWPTRADFGFCSFGTWPRTWDIHVTLLLQLVAARDMRSSIFPERPRHAMCDVRHAMYELHYLSKGPRLEVCRILSLR